MHPYPGRAVLGVLLGLAAILGRLTAATGLADQPVTVIAVQVRGSVEVQHGTAPETEKVVDGTQLGKDDTVTTAVQSSVMLVMPSGTVVALKEKSRLKIAVALQSPLVGDTLAATAAPGAEPAEPVEPVEPGVSQTSFELSFGEMLTRVRKLNPSSTFEVQTPVSVAAVRGTVFEISYQPGAKGDAQYQLSTASGLVHVRPHSGQMVSVPANQQMNLRAEIGKNGVKIKQVKSGKLDRRQGERIQKEGLDNERNAGDFMRRVQPAGNPAGPRSSTPPPSGTPGETARNTATGQSVPAVGQLPSRDNSTGKVAKPTSSANTPPKVTPPTARTTPTPTTKPVVPAAKPKVPARPPAIKRPPRPPGT